MSPSGCIAPGITATSTGIVNSQLAMQQVFTALGGYVEGKFKTITVINNISGDETKEQWINRRSGR
jgi:hypothetical protein